MDVVDVVAVDSTSVDGRVIDAQAVDMQTADAAVIDATPVDAPNPCTLRGGTCVVARRGGGAVPGFTFTCPSGTATLDGQTDWLGPGTELLPSGRISGGCPPGEGSFEPPLYGCCVPIDGGLDP